LECTVQGAQFRVQRVGVRGGAENRGGAWVGDQGVVEVVDVREHVEGALERGIFV